MLSESTKHFFRETKYEEMIKNTLQKGNSFGMK